MKSFFNHPLWLLVGLLMATAGLAHAQPVPPTVATLPASPVGATNATLKGIANPDGLALSGWFEWGTTTNYGNSTSKQVLGSGSGNVNFSQVVNVLAVGVTYHFRAVASNSFYVVFGTNQSFSIPVFSDIGAGLPGVVQGSAAWGDYDNDGRLDLLLTDSSLIPQVWRNTGGGFTNINASLPGFQYPSAAWGDYDNDGRLDILVAGKDSLFDPDVYKVFRNTGSGFSNSHTGTLNFGERMPEAWGDEGNDGRLDLLLGNRLYRNTGGGFTYSFALLPPDAYTSAAWGDYDNDGRLDILLDQLVYRNTGNGFSNINAGLPAVGYCSLAWGDYDNDGRLDILLTGAAGFSSTNQILSQVWRNTGSGFTNINAGLPGVFLGSAAWGDYDNDGRLDILLAGATDFVNDSGTIYATNGIISQVWRNTGSGFTNINAGLPGVDFSSAAWGDYNNDGRLDILLAGTTNGRSAGGISQVWRNNTPLTNTPPTAPTSLTAAAAGNTVTLSWNVAGDAQTPASGLTYNVRIGTTPGASDVMTAMSSASGFRRLPQSGNAQLGPTATFAYTLGTPYYWSVQAIDNSFAGSPFAAEASFKLLQANPVLVPFSATNIVIGDLNGDGVLDESELNSVLSNYFAGSPWLYLTNVAGLGGTNVTFALTNSLTGAFSVEYTTNLLDWYLLGPATPRYLFTDTNAPVLPQRYYRLRWP